MAIKLNFEEPESVNPLKSVTEKAASSAASIGFTVKSLMLMSIVILMMIIKVMVDLAIGTITFDVLNSLSYWVKNIVMIVDTSMIMILTSSAFADKEKFVNTFFKTYSNTLYDYFNAIQKEHKDGAFREYISAENYKRKLNAYTSLLTQKKLKWDHKRLALGIREGEEDKNVGWMRKYKFELYTRRINKYVEMLNRAEDDVYVAKYVGLRRIKYTVLTHGQFFGGMVIHGKNSDISLSENTVRHAFGLVLSKVMWFVAAGIGIGILTASFATGEAITTKQWVDAILSILQMLMAVYFGATDGIDRVRKELNHIMFLRCGFVGEFIEREKINV